MFYYSSLGQLSGHTNSVWCVTVQSSDPGPVDSWEPMPSSLNLDAALDWLMAWVICPILCPDLRYQHAFFHSLCRMIIPCFAFPLNMFLIVTFNVL